jgi:hypothetical protein
MQRISQAGLHRLYAVRGVRRTQEPKGSIPRPFTPTSSNGTGQHRHIDILAAGSVGVGRITPGLPLCTSRAWRTLMVGLEKGRGRTVRE